MLTVKHISLSGQETINLYRSVRFIPAAERQKTTEPSPNPPSVECYRADDGADVLFGGTIFVMNDFGKTVARYDLGASPVPLSSDGTFSATAYPPGMKAA